MRKACVSIAFQMQQLIGDTEDYAGVRRWEEAAIDSEEMNEYVLKPLYTQKEIREFRKQNEQDGNFIVTKDTVKSMEDLEKLFLVWQDATEVAEGTEEIEVGEELENENGLRFSKLVIKKSQ